MAGFQVLHMERAHTIAEGLRAHYRGDTRFATSEARAGLAPVQAARPQRYASWAGRAHGPEAGQALIDRVLAEPGRRGRKPVNVRLDFLLGGPPPFEALDGTPGWDMARVYAWARDTLTWLSQALPDAVAEHAVLHLDERSPHLHVTVVAYNADTDRLGWNQVRRGLAGRPVRHDGLALRLMHDRYHEAVGARYGLARDRGAAKVARDATIDRNQGELLRAAAGGYSDGYLAQARPEVRWAAVEGRTLRAQARGVEPSLDLEWELVQRYRDRFGGRDVAFRAPLAGTVTLQQAALAHDRGALDRERAQVQADRRTLAMRAGQVDTYARRLETVVERHVAHRSADLDHRERTLEVRTAAVEELLAEAHGHVAAWHARQARLQDPGPAWERFAGTLHAVLPQITRLEKALWQPLARAGGELRQRLEDAVRTAPEAPPLARLDALEQRLRETQEPREPQDRPRFRGGF